MSGTAVDTWRSALRSDTSISASHSSSFLLYISGVCYLRAPQTVGPLHELYRPHGAASWDGEVAITQFGSKPNQEARRPRSES